MAVAAIAVVAVAGVALSGLGGPDPAAGQKAAAKRPNVVVVMTDDQTVEQMGALDRVRKRIGRRGTTFTRNFSSYPLCCPSRSTFLTGQYSHNHKVRGNKFPSGGFRKLNSRNTLPVWLQRAGYATAHIGKYLNGYGRRKARRVPKGWGEWYATVAGTTYNFRKYCVNHDGRLLWFGTSKQVRKTCRRVPRDQRRKQVYQSDRLTSRAVNYIGRRSRARKPFFLSLAYLAPHGGGPNKGGDQRCDGSAKPAARHRKKFAGAPLPRPPGFNEADTSDKPAYINNLPPLTPADEARITRNYRCRRESLLAVDQGVGAIVRKLRRTGELANTIVIFTSDNGFFAGEHKVPGGKVKPYEPSVHVPLLMRGPGVPSGKRVDQLTANIDLAPTIVQAARARAGRRMDGVSLRRVARRPSRFSGRSLLLENGPDDGPRNPRYEAIRRPRYKYVEYRRTGERELYDLRVDPFEERNVVGSGQYAEVRQRLARKLERLRDCKGGGCR